MKKTIKINTAATNVTSTIAEKIFSETHSRLSRRTCYQLANKVVSQVSDLKKREEEQKKADECWENDSSGDLQLTVTSGKKQASKDLVLVNKSWEHSWAGSEGTKAEGYILGGNLSFGEDYHYKYYDNGNLTEDDSEKIPPEFSEKPFVVLIQEHSWKEAGEQREGFRGTEYDAFEYRLVIYLPNKMRHIAQDLRTGFKHPSDLSLGCFYCANND